MNAATQVSGTLVPKRTHNRRILRSNGFSDESGRRVSSISAAVPSLIRSHSASASSTNLCRRFENSTSVRISVSSRSAECSSKYASQKSAAAAMELSPASTQRPKASLASLSLSRPSAIISETRCLRGPFLIHRAPAQVAWLSAIQIRELGVVPNLTDVLNPASILSLAMSSSAAAVARRAHESIQGRSTRSSPSYGSEDTVSRTVRASCAIWRETVGTGANG